MIKNVYILESDVASFCARYHGIKEGALRENEFSFNLRELIDHLIRGIGRIGATVDTTRSYNSQEKDRVVDLHALAVNMARTI